MADGVGQEVQYPWLPDGGQMPLCSFLSGLEADG